MKLHDLIVAFMDDAAPGKTSSTAGLAGREAAWEEIRQSKANYHPHHDPS